ncbi:hypothetical protein Pfo_026527 [Paulownia fortunei]|nr:hypothetical protein Pfo_026527 [Paulownia fortunei]
MEELREIAKAHYRAGSPEVQALAYEFYQSMDTDGDDRVDLSEFLAFMRQEGYSHMHNPYFFNELDQDGNGTLDFSEVMTLYYIIKSGRPFCDCCGKFIPGIFFSCVECFKNSENTFDLCRDCYRSTKCNHKHDGRAQFLDNYTLLQANRDSALAQATGLNSNEPWITSSNTIVPVQQGKMYINTTYPTYNTYVVHPPSPAPNYSNAIVPASNWSKGKAALTAFEVALSIGNLSGTLCTIL